MWRFEAERRLDLPVIDGPHFLSYLQPLRIPANNQNMNPRVRPFESQAKRPADESHSDHSDPLEQDNTV